jgi:hypothetical protein
MGMGSIKLPIEAYKTFGKKTCIIREMYRAEVEPMPSNPPDRLPRTGLWKVVIYEADRFVRTDKENEIISVAERRAEELNYQFGNKKKAKGSL